MLLPITGAKGLSCPAPATLTVCHASYAHSLKVKPWLGISPWSHSPNSSLGRAGLRVPAQPWEAVLPGDRHGPRSHELHGDVFSVGQGSTRNISHESDGKGGSGVT